MKKLLILFLITTICLSFVLANNGKRIALPQGKTIHSPTVANYDKLDNVKWQETFNTTTQPTDWQVIDNDGSGTVWTFTQGLDFGGGDIVNPQADSSFWFSSWQNANGLLIDEWLISPRLPMIVAGDSLHLYAGAVDEGYDDSLKVWVSTTDSALGSFTQIAYFKVDGPTGLWYKYSFDLSAYAGSEIFVAANYYIVNGGATGAASDNMWIDHFAITFAPVNVTFQVDMSVQILEGAWNPVTDSVVVAGSFNGWNAGNDVHFVDPDVDSVYTGIWGVQPNSNLYYKFVMNGSGWEGDPNREASIGTNDVTLPKAWFNRDSIVTLTGTGDIEFNVDMEVMHYIGIYDQVNDSLEVRGGFNGWGDGDPMNQDFLNPNLWSVTHSFVSVPLGTQQYKYYVNLEDTNSLWTDGWERPTSQGGGNREVDFTGASSLVLPTVYYDDISPDWIIEDNENLQVTFNVDMAPAIDPLLQPIPFDPAADTLWWICEQPSFAFSQGWVDTDEMRVLQLTDPDGDNIFSGTLMVEDPGFNTFVYRYAFADFDVAAWTYEPSGFAAFAYRVRFAGQSAARTFPTNPWTMPVDTWTNAEIKTDQETDPFTALGIGEEGMEVPDKFTLYQNYPNPFNPNTNFKFDLPNKSDVKLVIYNVLGQQVATVIDNNLKAGEYAVSWNGLDQNGNQISSGVYFYKLETDNYTAVKKLVMLK